MIRPTLLASFASLLGALVAASAPAAPLSIELRLAPNPAAIALCRDPVVMAFDPIDHRWYLFFDLDANADTGDPTSGAEALLTLSTWFQTSLCAFHFVTPLEAFLPAGLLRWDPVSADWVSVWSSTLVVELPSLRTTFDDALLSPSGMPAITRIAATSVSGYGSSGVLRYAMDFVPEFTRGSSPTIAVADGAGDVQECDAPCSPGASWYPLADIEFLQFGGVTDHVLVTGFD